MKKYLLLFLLLFSFFVQATEFKDIKAQKLETSVYEISEGKIKHKASGATIEYSATESKWMKSTDGTNLKAFASGGGSGAGVNYLTNGSFESGKEGITDLSDICISRSFQNPSEGDEKYLECTSTLPGQVVEFATATVKDGHDEPGCGFEFSVKSNISNAWEYRLLKNGEVVESSISLRATTQDLSGNHLFERVIANEHLCRSGDTFKLVAESKAAGILGLNKVYIGVQLNPAIDTILPDVLSLNVSSGNGAVSSESVDFINGNCSDMGTGAISCAFKSGLFTVNPVCTATVSNASSNYTTTIDSVTTSGFKVRTFSSGAASNANVSIVCQKQGVDARESVKVHRLSPKALENLNVIYFNFNTSGVITASTIEDTGFELAAKESTGQYKYNLPVEMQGKYNFSCDTNTTTITRCSVEAGLGYIRVKIWDNSTKVDRFGFIKATKSGQNFKIPRVQRVLANQVQSSSYKGIKVEACQVNNVGTPEVSPDSGLCSSWVDSLSDSSVGVTVINFTAGTFSKPPVCTITPGGGGSVGGILASSLSSVTVNTRDNATNGDKDAPFYISCVGIR